MLGKVSAACGTEIVEVRCVAGAAAIDAEFPAVAVCESAAEIGSPDQGDYRSDKADKEFVSTVVSELIASAQLYEHGKGKLYGQEKPLPPDPFGSRKNKTALAKLTEAARKLMAESGVAMEVVLQCLHASMMEEPTAVQSTPTQVPVVDPTQPHHQLELNFDGQVGAESDNVPTVGS